MQLRRPSPGRQIIPASGTQGGSEQQAIPFMSARRIRMNIRAVLDDKDAWLTPAYSLAIQAEHLLQVIEGKRQVVADRVRAEGATTRIRWTDEMRLSILADPRNAREIAEEMGTTTANIHVQRCAARKLSAAA